MAHWKKQRELTLVVEGATTHIVLRPSEFGWEVKGWTHSVGNAKANPEGDSFFGQTYGDKAEAILAFTELGQYALLEPYEYTEPQHPMVDDQAQAQISNTPYPPPLMPDPTPPKKQK